MVNCGHGRRLSPLLRHVRNNQCVPKKKKTLLSFGVSHPIILPSAFGSLSTHTQVKKTSSAFGSLSTPQTRTYTETNASGPTANRRQPLSPAHKPAPKEAWPPLYACLAANKHPAEALCPPAPPRARTAVTHPSSKLHTTLR